MNDVMKTPKFFLFVPNQKEIEIFNGNFVLKFRSKAFESHTIIIFMQNLVKNGIVTRSASGLFGTIFQFRNEPVICSKKWHIVSMLNQPMVSISESSNDIGIDL